MKVQCIRLLDSRARPVKNSPWTREGIIYHVLSIWIEPKRTMFRLVGEQPTPALFEAEMFDVVSPKIPGEWVIASPQPGFLSFAPEPWNTHGFWERFFDGEHEATDCFRRYRELIEKSDP